MGGPVMTAQSSLDRLKGLDGLPTLEQQLQEATKLCTHSARSEMISRWLLGKFKTSVEARSNATSWELLSACLRLISPSRVASTLTQNVFIDSLQRTCANPELPFASVGAINQTITLLFEISEGPNGAVVKSLLSLPAVTAGAVCGSLFLHVYGGRSKENSECATWEEQSPLDPSFKIWNARARSLSDDEAFKDDCLVPACFLLTSLCQDGFIDLERKRKRGLDTLSPESTTRRSLESMIARHTIIPARSAFLSQRQPKSPRPRRKEQEPEVASIEERLLPLKESTQIDDSKHILNAIPLLLDIALCSVSVATTKQRLAERPWIERVFAALCDCFRNSDRSIRSRTLVAMLEVLVRHKFPLSPQILEGLVQENAGLDEGISDSVEWKLVRVVAELDTKIFLDRNLTQSVFDAITASIAQGHENSNPVSLAFSQELRDHLIVPILRTYAKSRNIKAFVEVWNKQLLHSKNFSASYIWSSIGEPFADLLEDGLPAAEITELFDRYALPVSDMARSADQLTDVETQCKANASFNILEAILSGIRNDEVLPKLQPRFDTLFVALMGLIELEGTSVIIVLPGQLWRLLTRTFNSWFPNWAVQQHSRKTVAERGVSLLIRKSFQIALSQCATPRYPQTTAPDIDHSAQDYVACLCACFQQYEDHAQCVQLCKSAIEGLCKQREAALPTLLKYPSLLIGMQSDSRKEFLSAVLKPAGDSHEMRTTLQPAINALLALEDSDLMKDLASSACQQIQDVCINGQTDKYSPFLEVGPLSIIRKIPASILSIDQREKTLIAAVGSLPTTILPEQLLHRVATIFSLLEGRGAESYLRKGAPDFWRLLKDGALTEPSLEEIDLEHFANKLSLIEETMTVSVQGWLSSHLDECPPGNLPKVLTEQMISHIGASVIRNRASRLKYSVNQGSVAFVNAAFSAISQAQEWCKQACFQQLGDATQSYIKSLCSAAECFANFFLNLEVKNEVRKHAASLLSTVLKAIIALPEFIIELADKPVLGQTASLAEKILAFSDSDRVAGGTGGQEVNINAACFVLVCRYRSICGTSLHNLAMRALEHNLEARDYVNVLETYDTTLRRGDRSLRLAAIASLLRDGSLETRHGLLLFQKTLRSASREDFEAAQDQSRFDAVHNVLHAAHQNKSVHVRRLALQTLTAIVKEKHFMVNQYIIEQTVTTMLELFTAKPQTKFLYQDICNLIGALLSNHRSRLQGRYHLLIVLFQRSITALFADFHSSDANNLATRCARSLARILEMFCNPPHVRSKNKTGSGLVDETRKAQALAGQYVQYVLHHYCAQILAGPPPDGVRDALMPGLWAVIEAIEMNSSEGIRVLSSSMNNSERAVLRSLYDDWKRFGKWEAGL